MIAEQITPTDPFSGLPLLLKPPDYNFPLKRSDLADDNHAFHPSTSPELESLSGQAIRNCRVQRADWYDHHIVYHGNYAGPEIVETETDRFRTVTLAAAGYIPDEAIDCSGYKPEIVPVTPDMRERLRCSGEVRMARPGVVRKFLAAYVLEQDLSHVSETKIDEFLRTTNVNTKRFLGQWLLAQATEVAAEPIQKDYRLAHRLGKINPALTTRPENFVQRALGDSYQRNPYVKQLHEKLAG